jgi:NACHT domain- and WD repeat-containing protein
MRNQSVAGGTRGSAELAPVFRLFVSSTFSDMQAERRVLHERVFPAIGRLCLERGARFHPIDLRWGISEAAGRDQRAMQICLEEIARCQKQGHGPHMLVMLGERYGWRPVPTAIEQNEFQGVVACLGRRPPEQRLVQHWYRLDRNVVPPAFVLNSRGELSAEAWSEIEARLHASLRTAVAALGLSPERRFCYEASATHQEIERGLFGSPAGAQVVCALRSMVGLPTDARARRLIDVGADGLPDLDAQRRLASLRAQLRSTLGTDVVEYASVWSEQGLADEQLAGFADSIEDRLWSRIESHLNTLVDRKPLSAEVSIHWSLAAERIKDAGGAAAPESTAVVLDYINRERAAPLIVTGPPGVGKTTFAAQIATQMREANVDVCLRFVGSSGSSSEVFSLLHGVGAEVSQRYQLEEPRATGYGGSVSELWALLSKVPLERRLVLLVDGVDLLGRPDAAARLDWVPARLPPNVRLILVAAPGSTLDFLLALPGCGLLQLSAPSESDAADSLDRWLAGRGRTLQAEQRALILGRFRSSGIMLYLRLAFEEAVNWRSDTAGVDLPTSVEGVIQATFARLSQESEHGTVLVSRTLAYLACGRQGLAEHELLAVLATNTDVMADFRRRSPQSPASSELPVAVWSRLLSDLAPFLGRRMAEGVDLLVFFHRLFLEVVGTSVPFPQRRERHQELTRYFAAQPISGPAASQRALVELPYQTLQGEGPNNLIALLTDYAFLTAKLGLLGPRPLLDDFSLVSARSSDALAALEEVIERDASLLAKRPAELAAQLHARLIDESNVAIQSLLEGVRATTSHPWLRPLRRSLSQRGRPLTRTFSTHGTANDASALTPDGRYLLAGCRDGSIEVWDVERMELVRTLLGHRMPPKCIAVAPDGRIAVSGSRARPLEDLQELRVWDVNQGRQIATFDAPAHDFGALEVLPGGTRLIAASYDGTVRIWDLSDGRVIHILRGHAWYVTALSVAANGKLAATGGDDGTIRLWDLDCGEALAVLESDHPVLAASPAELADGALLGVTQISSVSLSADGNTLVSGSPQEGVWVWDVRTRTRRARLDSHASQVRILPDGRRLVTLFHNGLELWDLETHELLGRATDLVGYRLVVSLDGRIAVTASGSTLAVWELEKVIGQVPRVDEYARSLALVEQPPHLIAVIATQVGLSGWNVPTGERLWLRERADAWDLAAIPNRAAVIAARTDGVVETLNALTGEATPLETTPENDQAHLIAVAADGQIAAVASRKSIAIWDLGSGRLRCRIAVEHVKDISIVPKTSILVSLSDRGAYAGERDLKCWDLRTGSELPQSRERFRWLRRLRHGPDLRSSSSHPHRTHALVVTPDGRFAITALSGDGLKRWDLRSAMLQPQTLYSGASTQEEVVAALRDTRVVAPDADDGTKLVEWDLASGNAVAVFEGTGSGAAALAVSGDRKRLLNAGSAVWLWDVETHKPLASFTLEHSPTVCALSETGRFAVVGDRGTVHFLAFESGTSETRTLNS